MALDYFKREQVDFALIEVGLGGRLDATNIISPIVSVITSIGLDHTEFLGTTRSKIAREKGGIIKKAVPVVIGEKDSETAPVFEQIAHELSAPLFYSKQRSQVGSTDLRGLYQEQNIKTALTAIDCIKAPQLNDYTIREGLKNIIKTTNLQGRWQQVNEHPTIILDVAHNLEGIQWIVAQLKQMSYNQLHLVMGFVKGKKIKDLLAVFPEFASFYLSSPKLDRALEVAQLKEELRATPYHLNYYPTIKAAFFEAKSVANQEDLIVVCGSTFVVAEVLGVLEDKI